MFIEGDVDAYGRWDEHVWSWVRNRGSDMFVIQFESLLADPAGWLEQAAAFLGLDVSSEDVRTAVDHNSVDRMRAKGAVAHSPFAHRIDPQRGFVRAARAGTWILELSELDVAAIDSSFGELMSKLGYRSLFGILKDSSVGRPTSVDWAVPRGRESPSRSRVRPRVGASAPAGRSDEVVPALPGIGGTTRPSDGRCARSGRLRLPRTSCLSCSSAGGWGRLSSGRSRSFSPSGS